MSFTTLPYADPIAIEIDNCLTFDTDTLVFRPDIKIQNTRRSAANCGPKPSKTCRHATRRMYNNIYEQGKKRIFPALLKRHFIPSLGAAHPLVSVPPRARGYVTRPIPIVTYCCREKNCTARRKCKSFKQGFKAIKTPEDALTVVPPRGIRPIQRRRRLL